MIIAPSNNEHHLLAALKQGSPVAFTEIFNLYWRKLYGIAYLRLQSKEVAEDIVQEVLTGLWHRREVADIQSLPAYLAAATRYSVIKHLANPHASYESIEESHATAHFDADTQFILQMVRDEVNRLPEKCRLVFLYSRNEGLSNKEIAEKMEVGEKAVEKHITSALSKLRSKIKSFLFSFSFLFFFID